MKQKTPHNGQRLTLQAGFTLLEIIVSILLIGIIGVVSLSFLSSLVQTSQDSDGQLQVIDDVNFALNFLTQELRTVDDFIWPIQCGGPTAAACTPGVTYSRVVFSKNVETPLDPARVDTNLNDIAYNLNGTNLERTSNGITTTLATNVTSFTISELPPPPASPPGTPNGPFQITLAISRPGLDPGTNYQFTGTTGLRIRNRFPVLSIAFVVNNPANLHATREVPMNDHLTNVLGQNVTLFDDDDGGLWIPGNFNVVVLSGQGGANDDAWLSNVAVPILTVRSRDRDEFDLGTGDNQNGDGSSPNITDNSHFITQNFPTGNIALDTGGALNRGRIQGFAFDVQRLISYGNINRAKLLIVEAGGRLAFGGPGNTAPARRAFYGVRQLVRGGNSVNRDGLQILNRTLIWLAG